MDILNNGSQPATPKIEWVWMVMAYRDGDMKNHILIDQGGFYLDQDECEDECGWMEAAFDEGKIELPQLQKGEDYLFMSYCIFFADGNVGMINPRSGKWDDY